MISKKWKFLRFLKYSSIEAYIYASRYLISFLFLFFFSLNWYICVVHCMFFYEYVSDVIINMILFTICICHVHVFSWIFFSWLTCLWFNSSLISKSVINHYNPFLNKRISIFSLNTDLKIFLKFFSKQKQICIFIKYRSEFFFQAYKTSMYFH